MRFFLPPLMLLSALGLLLCAIIHLMAWTGHLPALQEHLSEEMQEQVSVVLGAGIFAVWLPAVLIAQRINNGNRLKFSWKKVLVGCPPWLTYAAFAVFAYAFLNFFLVIGNRDIDNAQGVRAFTGHGMMFYCLAFCIFLSSWNRPQLLRTQQCPAGHDVGHEDRFCPLCGLPTSQSGQDGL